MALSFEKIVQKLTEIGVESPRLEARMLIAEAKGIEVSEVSAFSEILQNEETKLSAMLDQRAKHRPMDKIIGHREFYKYDFLCNDDVLSPRPDTEILVESAAKLIFKNDLKTVLDLGVGSGCVLLSLLADFPFLFGKGIDIEEKALKVARQNVLRLGLEGRAEFICADWNSDNFVADLGQKFDIIVSNPPYIPSKDIAFLAPEVRDYDPLNALDGGASGLEAYERIAEIAPKLLKTSGYLLFESGYNQGREIAQICEKNGFTILDIAKDLAGIERCVIAQK